MPPIGHLGRRRDARRSARRVGHGLGPRSRTTTLQVVVETDLGRRGSAIRLEAVGRPASPAFGPGRTPHGNFVLTGFSAATAPIGQAGRLRSLIASGRRPTSRRPGFDPAGTLDDDPRTGWAIDDGSGRLRQDPHGHASTVKGWPKARPAPAASSRSSSNTAARHTLGRFRLSARRRPDPSPEAADEEPSRAHLAAKSAEWERRSSPHRWTVLTPVAGGLAEARDDDRRWPTARSSSRATSRTTTCTRSSCAAT